MAVRTTGRRNLVYQGKDYVWYVKEDDDFCGNRVLHIISQDKTLILACPLEEERPSLISKGRIFQGTAQDGIWHHYKLPHPLPDPITPKVVTAVIEWAEYGTDAQPYISA